MEKYFIPFDRAVKLKELGFNEECVAYYENNLLKAVDQHWGMSFSGISKKLGYEVDNLILAPLFSQSFSFFREEYNYDVSIVKQTKSIYQFVIQSKFYEENFYFINFPFKTFEEVELACIDKLIEICKKLVK